MLARQFQTASFVTLKALMNSPATDPAAATVGQLIARGAAQLAAAGVSFGHGTTNARDEAAWLVLWRLGLPLDSPLGD